MKKEVDLADYLSKRMAVDTKADLSLRANSEAISLMRLPRADALAKTERGYDRLIYLILTIILYFHAPLFPISDFLNIDPGARPSAIGSAFTAVSDDANAVYNNPAGLAGISAKQLMFMHNAWFQGISQEYLAFVSDKGIGGSINLINWGRMNRTTLQDRTGISSDDFSINESVLTLSFGRKLNEFISAGVGLKYIQEKLDFAAASALGIDAGIMYQPAVKALKTGLVIQNIGTRMKYEAVQENLPLKIKAGASYAFDNTSMVAIDFEADKDGNNAIHFGGEYLVFKRLVLRAGYNGSNQADTGLCAGLGFEKDNFGIDYSFVPYGDLGATQRISISYKIAKPDRLIHKDIYVETQEEDLKKLTSEEVQKFNEALEQIDPPENQNP